jgi:hypothetical protein
VIIAAEPKLRRDPGPVIEQYRADLPNIRGALRWSLAMKEGGRIARMAVAMWPFSVGDQPGNPIPVDRRASQRER